jgi:hypothetical protein
MADQELSRANKVIKPLFPHTKVARGPVFAFSDVPPSRGVSAKKRSQVREIGGQSFSSDIRWHHVFGALAPEAIVEREKAVAITALFAHQEVGPGTFS